MNGSTEVIAKAVEVAVKTVDGAVEAVEVAKPESAAEVAGRAAAAEGGCLGTSYRTLNPCQKD